MESGASNPNHSLARMIEAESNLLQTGNYGSAKRYVSTVMQGTVNPLESINNLIYIVKQMPEGSEPLRIYLEMIEGQLERLNAIVERTLVFCNEDSA